MQINRSDVKVMKFNFETPEKQYEITSPEIQTNIVELAPVSNEDSEVFEKGKICRLELTFNIQLQDFKVEGLVTQSIQFVDYFDEIQKVPEEAIQELSRDLLDYVQRLTYDVTEISFDRPGYDLKFEPT